MGVNKPCHDAPKKAHTKRRSQNSTNNGAYTSDTALPTATEKRGAGRADELTILGLSIADILLLGGTWPPVGAKKIQDPNVRSATSTVRASSTSSAPNSTKSATDLPTTFYAELEREGPSMKSNFYGQEQDFWPSGTSGWSKQSMHGMSAHTLKTIQQLRRLRHIALEQGDDRAANKAKLALWELTGKAGYR